MTDLASACDIIDNTILLKIMEDVGVCVHARRPHLPKSDFIFDSVGSQPANCLQDKFLKTSNVFEINVSNYFDFESS